MEGKEKKIECKLIKLPEIKSAGVKVHFPSTVTVSVKEYKRIAYISKAKAFLPVLENGQVLDKKKTSNLPLNAPVLYSFSEGRRIN